MLAVATLDDLFAASETPFSLLNLELLTNAKLVALLALYGWASPLIVILTTNTLLVEPMEEVRHTTCPSVRTLNFSQEAESKWRDGPRINDFYQISLNIWYTTMYPANDSDPNFFDYWAGLSNTSRDVFQAGTIFKRPFTNPDDTFAVCEKGWNCTMEIQFTGPGYQCQELARGIDAKVRSLHQQSGEAKAPWPYDPFDTLVPNGGHTWTAHASMGDYANPQVNDDTWGGGVPDMDPPFPKNLGAFRTEPVVWIAYSAIIDSSVPSLLEPNNSRSFNPKAWDPVLIACEHYEVEYIAELRYIDGNQLHRIRDRRFLSPIINTTVSGHDANDGTLDNITAIPEGNYIIPRNVEIYQKTAAYYAIGAFFRSIINGTIYQPGNIMNSNIIQTDLLDQKTYNPYPDIQKRLERYYDTLILSLLGNPRFVCSVWAADPSVQTGTNNGSEYRYGCTRSRPATAYYYRARNLVLVYGEGNCSESRELQVAEPQYGFGFHGEVDQTPAVRSRRAFPTNAAADG
ncbi:hypothetical protein CGCVW01_v010004 [Colletotrichum viniferum]|nr:hypothetical protein CGCVW01_v010004 [Colletotrichum viniferum]